MWPRQVQTFIMSLYNSLSVLYVLFIPLKEHLQLAKMTFVIIVMHVKMSVSIKISSKILHVLYISSPSYSLG